MVKMHFNQLNDPYHRLYLGKQAELAACSYLEAKGFRLLKKNYRCYLGEIDLIMQDLDDIVFVEVRSRSRFDYGNASESIDKRKKSKLIKTATHFLQTKSWLYKVHSRFDVVAIHYVDNKMNLEWIKNAFWLEE